MEFHPRLHPFSGHELAELVAISPDDAAMQQGFHLQDPEVDDVIRTAKDLEAGYIDPDTSLTAEENVELLLRTTRLLQLGLEVQYAEGQAVLVENNTLRGDLRELEDQNRRLEGEVAELRELRDQEGFFGDAKELELELKELRQTLDEERKANSQLIEQTDQDRATIDDLEGRLQRSDDTIRRKDDELLDQREQLARLRDDFDELRGQYAALTAQGHGKEQQRELSETIRQQEWKIERLTKDNRALEASNCELRAQLEALKEENLQVSEKILLLDAEAKELRLATAAADDRAEVLAREKVQVMGLAEELRADVAAKMALLDEFEARFARQYRSWDEERSSLVSQIEALRKEARLYATTGNKANGAGGLAGDGSGGGASGSGGAHGEGGEGSPQAQLAALKKALDEAKENEVLLLEAYEQLEADVGQEVDRALGRQAEEVARLSRRVQFLEGHLETEKKQVEVLGEEVSRLEEQLGDATARMAQYESGVYGLPQAALEIRQLKGTVAAGENRVKELVQQVNKLSAALEDLSDEAMLLRRKAGLPADEPLDISGVKLQKDITIAQLRSVNALLERQVSDLEEERRKLRLEVKFRAKYHGKTALEMGLTPEQLLLLEEYVEGLKGGRNPEERLVTQLQQRIEFLEVRLAEVMAYADIPINMRPALTELSSGSMSALAAVGTAGHQGPHAANLQHLFSGLSSQTDGSDGSRGAAAAAGVAGSIKTTQVELVRGALLGCLKMLRQMSEALAEHRQISDTEYKQFTDTIIDKLIDAERVASMLLKDLVAAAAAASNSATAAAVTAATTPTAEEQQAHASRRYSRAHAVLDENFVADAAADELRERLQQLAKQVVELQVSLAQKDALLSQLAQHKAAMEARLGLSGGPDNDAAGVAAAAVAARRGGDYVPREQHEQLEIQMATIKEQLIECLEELNSRELELTEMSSACRRYQSDMAELSDQVRLLYREHSNSTASWQQKCSSAEKQLKKAQAEAADATTQLAAVEHALQTLEKGDIDAIKRQYVDAVRKMAVTQLKHAKLARQLESAVVAEKAASERVEELQEELQDCSSTCRSRMRWLEQAAADAARRTQQLYRCLQNAAPLEAYQALVAKHSQLAQEHRKLLEQWGDNAVSDEVEEVLAVRQQLADLIPRYDAACDTVAELREKLRQLELPSALASKSNPAFNTPSSRPQLAAAPTSQAITAAAGPLVPAAGAVEVQLQLNQDLVAATVKLDSASRRLEVLERDKDRLNKSLEEAQALSTHLEQRLATVSAELSTSRALEGRLQQRLAASVPAAQLDQMAERLQVAEAAAAQEESRMTALTLRAEEAERKLAELGNKRQRQLADITNLKATVRELSSSSDTAAQFGKLADELSHVRAKEGLARSALNRSEMERVELERQTRSLKQHVASLTVQLSLAQDQARWAESELLDTLMRLEIGLAGRVEAWKATRWAAKLEQLKSKNDSLAQALESAVKRFSKLEDAAHEAQLATDIHADIAALLSRGASEAHREMAALKQQQMNLKLEAGRLTRAELLMRQKVGYLESVNAELCEQLERCDAEALSHQGGLQAEKAELAARMRQLQEEVVRLQERSSNYLAELEELKTARSSKSLLSADAGDSQAASQAVAVVAAKSALADKELMMKQIDSLKEARTEAEHMRLEVRRLETSLDRKEVQLVELQAAYDDVLERLKGQSNELLAALGGSPGSVTLGAADETALSQLRSIAEAAMRELQSKVKEREDQLSELSSKLQEHQAAYLEQHARDRAEIEALSNKLFESGAASIAGLKANLAKASAALAATGDGGEELPYEQLRLLLEQRSSEVEVLRNRLDQREASLETLKKNYDAQARHQELEIQRLTASLSAAPKEDVSRPGSKAALQRLASEVKAKDVKLKQLRGAIKALEEKLAQLLKDKVDIVLQASSWVEQEQLDERLTDMEAQKAQLAADLQATQAELAASRKSLAMQESMMHKMSEQLLKEGEALTALKAELAKEQAAAKALRDKLAKGAASPSSSSAHEEELRQQLSSLSKRIAALEGEKQHLQAEVSRLTAFTAALQTSAAEAAPAPAKQAATHAASKQPTGKGDPQHSSQSGAAAAARRTGLALVKPHRLASTLKSAESVGMPGTPTDAAAAQGPGQPGRGAARFSSDGGGSAVGTGTPDGTLTGSSAASRAGQSNRFLQGAGGGSSGGLRESDSGAGDEGGAGAGAGVSYAPQHWEEVKMLQGKVDALRRKLVKKGEECDNLLKECERRNTLLASLTADRDKASAAAAAAQARLRKQDQEVTGPPIPAVDASKLKDYVEQVLHLHAEKDELLLQLELLKQPQQQPAAGEGLSTTSSSNSGTSATEQELLQLRLQKEQAVATAVRLKQQLAELFHAAGVGAGGGSGQAAAASAGSAGGTGNDPGSRPVSAAGAGNSLRRSSAGGSRGGAALGRVSGREAELLATVGNLKAALEKAMACSTPNTRHMQEVQQRKAAQKEADKLRGELDRLKPQLSTATSKVAELQAANAALRVSVSELKQRLLLAADSTPVERAPITGSQSAAAAGGDTQQVAVLQQQLAHSEAEAAKLKQQLAGMEQQLAQGAYHTAGGQQDVQGGQQVVSLQQQVAALQQENQDLRHELGAFDPAFFEELEDLKHSHHQLQQKAAAQAKLIRQLQHQLTRAPGGSQRASASGIGPEGSSGSGVGGRSARLVP